MEPQDTIKSGGKRNLALKIIVPLTIICAIAGVFLIKTAQKQAQQNKAAQSVFELESIDLEAIFETKLPVLIDFGASWCGPCRSMADDLAAIYGEMQGKAIVHYVDVDNVQGVADFPIQVVPTQVIYTADGKPYVPSENMPIAFTMYSSKDTDEHVFTVHEGTLTQEEMRAVFEDMGVVP